jgi:hypothetical protein
MPTTFGSQLRFTPQSPIVLFKCYMRLIPLERARLLCITPYNHPWRWIGPNGSRGFTGFDFQAHHMDMDATLRIDGLSGEVALG